MDCAACVYYAGASRCKLHGELKTLDVWTSCDDFIDACQKFVGGACCGIYNFPTLSRPGGKPEKEN